MRFWGLSTCDTARKALKALKEAGRDPQVTDVRADGVLATDLAKMHAVLGDKLLNKASTTWRGLSDSEKEAPVLELLAAHPTLIKRPVIAENDAYTVGWDKATQAKWLG